MIELSGFDLLAPAVVSVLVIAGRQFSSRLDGASAYWWALGLNILAQVTAELVTNDGGVTAAGISSALTTGAALGGTVSVGVATAGKRVGLSKLVKPRLDE